MVFFIVPAMYSGGQERCVSRLTEILQDTYVIKVILFDDSIIDYPIYGEYFSLQLPSKTDRNPLMRCIMVFLRARKLRQLINKYKPFAALSFGGGANLVNIIASTGKCRPFLSIQGYGGVRQVQGWENFFRRYLYSKAEKIVCVSKAILNDLAEVMPQSKDKLCLLYNAYNMEEIRGFSLMKTDMDSVFAEKDVIVTVGTLDPVKGYWHLIKALYLLKQKRKDLLLLQIGPDYYQHGKVLKKLVSELGLDQDVIFLGYQDNPYKYVAKSKLFVLSSISEGFPNVLVEAMACGVPVVATDCKSGPGEILSAAEDKETAVEVEFADYGILVPPLNGNENYDPGVIEKGEEKLMRAIDTLLTDKEMWLDYASKAQQRAACFSYERWKTEILSILEA